MIELLVYFWVYFFLGCFFLFVLQVKDRAWAFFCGAITWATASAIVKFI
jgi:hypothetical protein